MFPDDSSPASDRPEGDAASAPNRKVLSLSAAGRERVTDGSARQRPTVRPAGRARNPVVRPAQPQERGARPGDRDRRDERGPRADRTDRPDRGDRGERPARAPRADRPPRDNDRPREAGDRRSMGAPRAERPYGSDRAGRGDRPEGFERRERAPRPDGARFDRERRSDAPRSPRGPRPEGRMEEGRRDGYRNEGRGDSRPPRDFRGDARGSARGEGRSDLRGESRGDFRGSDFRGDRSGGRGEQRPRTWSDDRNERPPRNAFGGDRERHPSARRDGFRPEQREERVRREPLAPAVPTAAAGGMRPYVPGQRSSAPQRDPSEGIRLNKRLSDMGLCSRREGDEWIERGWVLVNAEVAVMGQLVQPQDRVTIDERAKGQQAQQVTILLNKPVGYVSGQAEDGYRPAASLIEERTRWRDDDSRQRFHPAQLKGLAPAGRLDIDSVGLLVLTQDGRVARQIIGEDSSVDKEYLVRVEYGQVTEDVQAVFPQDKLALLRHGLSLDGEPLQPAQVDWQNPEQLRFVLTEGKKRQIRRMCEAVGLRVVGLKRIRIGGVVLGNLPTGQWRYLLPHEKF